MGGAVNIGLKVGSSLLHVNGLKTALVDFPCNHLVSINKNYIHPNVALFTEFFNSVTLQMEYSTRYFEEDPEKWIENGIRQSYENMQKR